MLENDATRSRNSIYGVLTIIYALHMTALLDVRRMHIQQIDAVAIRGI
jgi:hypothetical protein